MIKKIIEYHITKKECQKQIDKLNNVCSYCGSKLEPIETVDNGGNPTYWAGCLICSRFNWGVSQKVYDIAYKMVVEKNYISYSFLEKHDKAKEPALHKEWLRSQIGGATNTVREILNYNNSI